MRVPQYRHWKTRDKGYAQGPEGRVYFKGKHNSPESLAHYDAWVATLQASADPQGLTLHVFGAMYLAHAERVYGAGPRDAAAAASLAVRPVMLGDRQDDPVQSFGPLALQEVRREMIDAGLARETINARVGWIRRWFAWGVSQEIVSPEQLSALQTVQGLRKGRGEGRESTKRQPAEWRDVEPVFAELPPPLRAALWLQWYTGCRSGSLVMATPSQFEEDPQGSGLLLWRPRHKTEARADLVIPIGPQAQAQIGHLLEAKRPGAYLFSPRDARHNGRAGTHYSSWSYRRALVRAQDRARRRAREESRYIPQRWTPHQLRHARGHLVRSRFGVEAAQAALGHESLAATQLYSAARVDLAKQVALDLG